MSDARSAAIAETSNDVEAAFASFGFKEPAKVSNAAVAQRSKV